MAHLSRVVLLAVSSFLLWSPSSIAQDVYQLPPESRKDEAEVRGSLFVLKDAIRRGDVSMLRSVLDRDYAEEDVTSGREQAIDLISDLLNRAAVRSTPVLSEGTRPGLSVQGNRPPFWDFDLVDIRIVALYGGVRATVTCEPVMHALPYGYSTREQEAGGAIGREIQLDFEKTGSRWVLRSSDNLVQFLRDAVQVMERR